MSDDAGNPTDTHLRTFLIADVRGYTRFTQESGDEAASALTARFAEIVRGVMPGFGGELLELRGDEALCVFTSARQALRAAVELQRRLREPPGDEQRFPLGVGIGLDAGEAVPTEGGYRGAALNLAARLCAIAKPGQILATERVVGLTGPVEGLHSANPRSEHLKGVQRPERLVTIEPDTAIAPPPQAPRPPTPPGHNRGLLGAAAAVVIAIAVVAGVLFQIHQGTAKTAVVRVAPESLAEFDPKTGAVSADVPLSATPESMTAGYGQVWIGNEGGSITSAETSNPHSQSNVGIRIDPTWIAAGAGAVWAYDGLSSIAEVDPNTQSLVAGPRRLWRCGPLSDLKPSRPECGGGGVTVVGTQVWVGHAPNSLYSSASGVIVRLDSATLKTVGTIHRVTIGTLGNDGAGGVWSAGTGNGLQFDRIDVASGTISRNAIHQQRVGAFNSHTTTIATGFGFSWTATGGGVLYRLATDGSSFAFQVPPGLTSIATSPQGVWLATNSGQLLLVNPTSGIVRHRYPLGNVSPVALSYAAGHIWVAVA